MRYNQGYHKLCTNRDNCAGTSDRECTWRWKNPFCPYALWLSACKHQAVWCFISMVLCLAAFLWDQSLVAHLPSHPASKCCQPHFIATIIYLTILIMLYLHVCPFTRRYIYNTNEHFHMNNIRLRATLIFM